MRQIGTIHSEQNATRFGAFLRTIGIDNTVEPSAESSSESWAVWVANDDHLDKARQELEKFESAPADPRYEQALGTARAIQIAEEKEAERRQKNFVDVRTRGGQMRQYNTPLTYVLIAISAMVYLLSLQRGNANGQGIEEALRFNSSHVLETIDGPVPIADPPFTAIRRGEIWRLVTPIFLHFSFFHILFNMFWLRDLGGMIEARKGTIFLGVMVLVIAVLSNTGQLAYGKSPFFGGMSGVVYGLFGYIWIKGRTDPMAGMGLRQETVVIMLVWLVACMIGFGGRVANGAHVCGLISGMAFAYTPYLFRQFNRR